MSWDLGWDALVAAGTLALAGSTSWLAFATQRMAKEALADQVAQRRPMVVPGPVATWVGDDLHVDLTNVGRGPARFLRANLNPGGWSISSEHRAVLAAGETYAAVFFQIRTGTPAGRMLLLALDYEDSADQTWSTTITLTPKDGNYTIYDVRFLTIPQTQKGPALFPQDEVAQFVVTRPDGLWIRLKRALRG